MQEGGVRRALLRNSGSEPIRANQRGVFRQNTYYTNLSLAVLQARTSEAGAHRWPASDNVIDHELFTRKARLR